MFKRALLIAIAGLGATVSHALMNSTGALILADLPIVDDPSKVLKITEVLANPSVNDDGNEYFEITNIGPNSVELKDVWFLYIDGETSEKGEVDVILRLGAGANRDQSRILAAGTTIVFRDVDTMLDPDAPWPIVPQGGTVVELNFESTPGMMSAIKNSMGMFALIHGVNGIAAGDQLDAEQWVGGVKQSNNPDGILDFTQNGGAAKWTDTFHVVDIKRARDEPGTEYFYSASTLPDAGNDGYEPIVCTQQNVWTPDGFSLLKRDSTGLWVDALIYDTAPKTNPGNVFNFDANEYLFGVLGTVPATHSGNPRCTPGLVGQYQVKQGPMGAVTYTH